MRRQMILTTLTAFLSGVCAAHAQEPRDFSLLATQTIHLPGTGYSVTFNSPELQVGEPRNMADLSVAIGAWLSVNFGLPPMHRLPRIAYASAREIEGRQAFQPLETETTMESAALYDRRAHMIFLPDGWTGSTLAEMSVFVRQLVYHLQDEAKNAYQCTPSGDKFALAVQRRWLGLLGNEQSRMGAAGDDTPSSSPHCVLRQSRAE